MLRRPDQIDRKKKTNVSKHQCYHNQVKTSRAQSADRFSLVLWTSPINVCFRFMCQGIWLSLSCIIWLTGITLSWYPTQNILDTLNNAYTENIKGVGNKTQQLSTKNWIPEFILTNSLKQWISSSILTRTHGRHIARCEYPQSLTQNMLINV